MCNAWNHSPSCNCGWGGDTGGSSGTIHSFSKTVGATSSVETRKIKCWWCNEEVFYHTNGYGDSVLFNELGYPWQVHECWQKYRKEHSGNFCNTSNKTSMQQRYAVLEGCVRGFKFSPEEHSVALEMGLTVKQLKAGYRDLYYVDNTHILKLRSLKEIATNEIRAQINQQLLNQRLPQPKPRSSAIQKQLRPKILEIRRAVEKPKLKQASQNSKVSKGETNQKVSSKCPYCKKAISRSLFKQHVQMHKTG